jgi:hypothetical protein
MQNTSIATSIRNHGNPLIPQIPVQTLIPFEIFERTVIGHLSLVIGEKRKTLKPSLIGRNKRLPAPPDSQKFFINLPFSAFFVKSI